uniref:Uncharacterized protein n=1 Tax=Scleropages formosus TaxID=113540 RepID=A0A8C9SBG3_SCLFO
MSRLCVSCWHQVVCSPGWTNIPSYFSLRGLTSMCSRVKITGSVINTRLDSLLIEAAIM